MNEPEQGSGGGWSFFKILGLIVGLLGMAGFGLCGMCGILLGIANISHGMGFAVALGVVGLLIAGAFFLLARAMTRSAQRNPPNEP